MKGVCVPTLAHFVSVSSPRFSNIDTDTGLSSFLSATRLIPEYLARSDRSPGKRNEEFWDEVRTATLVLSMTVIAHVPRFFLSTDSSAKNYGVDPLLCRVPFPPRLLTSASTGGPMCGPDRDGNEEEKEERGEGGGALGLSEKQIRSIRQRAADADGKVPLLFYMIIGATRDTLPKIERVLSKIANGHEDPLKCWESLPPNVSWLSRWISPQHAKRYMQQFALTCMRVLRSDIRSCVSSRANRSFVSFTA